MNFLQDNIPNDTPTNLKIPLQSDGTNYTIQQLKDDQQDILAYILARLKQWIDSYNAQLTTYQPLHMTICGQAGSGKSVLIKTLLTLLRNMFRRNDSCYICAPTGSAAFQAGGQTIHSLFGIKTKTIKDNPSRELQQKLQQKFANIVALIVDERSMISSEILATMERYSRLTFHKAQDQHKLWGNIPLLIFVGDDYQLPPIMPGAFDAIDINSSKPTTVNNNKPYRRQTRVARGEHLFLLLGKDVMVLTASKRTCESQERFRNILQGARCADDQQLQQEDIEFLQNFHLMNPHFSDHDRKELAKDALFLFANKAPRDYFNLIQLHQKHSKSNPVATIKAETTKKGLRVANNSHYDSTIPPATNLCREAQVSITGCNLFPSWGLYNGSIGEVMDIVYEHDHSPNNGDLPLYVLVRLSDYNGPPLLSEDPKLVPIVPVEMLCNNGCCCKRKFIPLSLAFAKTIHTFQGGNAGPVDEGKPPNPIQRIICDPGTKQFEGINIGLFYTLLSRATSLGNIDDATFKDSAIYFIGNNMNEDRIRNITKNANGNDYLKVSKRNAWINYLHKHKHTSGISNPDKQSLFQWAECTKISHSRLQALLTYHSRL